MHGSLNPTLHRLLQLCRLDRTWTRGEGVWLFDDQGRRFLDCYAQYGAVPLGHNAAPVVAAVRAALDAVEPAMVQPYQAPHAVALADELTRLAPGRLTHCLFTTSGAETVEAAVKVVRARTGRPLILSAHGSFHGKTLGALAATGQPHHAEGFGPLPPGFEHVPFGDADALAERLNHDAHRIAAVLLEPIQGERGVHLPPPGYLRRVRELCSRHGVALILDEIQTGLGRTGRLFACEEENVAPDVLLLAKGLGGGLFPLGACLVAADWWSDHFGLRHSSTFANNNVACRVGRAVLETLTRDGFCAEVARKGERVLNRLRRLAERYPGVIAAVRGRGLLTAIELRPHNGDDGIFLSFLCQHGVYAYAVAALLAEEAGVLLLPTLGETPVLRFTPPLIINDDELELALSGIENVCTRLAQNPAKTVARTLGALCERTPTADTITTFLPPPVRRAADPASYAFLMHPTRLDDFAATNPGFEQLSSAQLRRFGAYLAGMPPLVVLRIPSLRTPSGKSVEGFLLSLPWLPEEMTRRGRRPVSAAVAQAVDLAARCGAQVVGLGGHTAPFSGRGQDVVGRGPAITTGNALTAGMAVAAIRRALADRALDVREIAVAVVGARGSVGGLCARLLARDRPRRLLLVGNPATGRGVLDSLRRELEWAPGTVTVTTDLRRLDECAAILTASGAARAILSDMPLSSGTILCDIAKPPDVSQTLRARPDLFVFDGGLVSWPDSTIRVGAGNLLGFPDGVQLACLSETALLALADDRRDHGIGGDVPVAEVDYVMELAARHGFRLAPLSEIPASSPRQARASAAVLAAAPFPLASR
jgi:acetylornithine/succinyldiaminopimelate/putrescine aminotransferase/predicted amino acid dehydrogenase